MIAPEDGSFLELILNKFLEGIKLEKQDENTLVDVKPWVSDLIDVHPDLLGTKIESAIAERIESTIDEVDRASLLAARQILAMCRKAGGSSPLRSNEAYESITSQRHNASMDLLNFIQVAEDIGRYLSEGSVLRAGLAVARGVILREMMDDPLLDREALREAALKAFSEGLPVLAPLQVDREIGLMFGTAGLLWAEGPSARRAENQERAITCYEQALRIYSEANTPHEGAPIQNSLGLIYANRVGGDRVNNLERAINCYEAALRIYSKNETPYDLAATQSNLGAVYIDRLRGDQADNLEKSIEYFSEALNFFNQDNFSQIFANIQNNLGIAYTRRLRGDRADNIEMAVKCLGGALEICGDEENPQICAAILNNLGIALTERLCGDRGRNLETAIACHKSALDAYSIETAPHDWAGIKNNLGTIYAERLYGNQAENIEQAINCFEAALQVYSELGPPLVWASTQSNLGAAYSDRLQGNPATNLERAIECYEAALGVCSEAETPRDWARITNNLGNAYMDRLRGNRMENLEHAISCYETALPLLRTIEPILAVSAGLWLGSAQLELGRRLQAHTIWREELDLQERIFAVGRNIETQATSVRKIADLVTKLAKLEVELGHVEIACGTLERGQALSLRAKLGLDEAWLESLSPDLRVAIERASADLDALRAKPPSSADGAQPTRIRVWEAALRSAQTDLEAALAMAKEGGGFALPQGLDAASLAELAPENGAVVFFTTADVAGLAVLLAREGAPVAINLPGIDRDVLRDFLNRWFEACKQIPPSANDGKELRSKLQASNAILVGVLDEIWKRIMGPVLDRLADLGITGEIVLMPQGDLAMLPLHAAGPRVGDEVPWCVLDRHVVSYTPSGFVLRTAHERLARRKADGRLDADGCGRSLLGLFNPMRDTSHRLPQAEDVEMPALSALFEQLDLPALCWAGPHATVERMVDATEGAGTAGYVHLACHGGFDEADPQASWLQLAGNEQFTVARIVRELRLGASRWVALSACESGMVDVYDLPNEFVGLPAAFLQAGAPGVVATLWSVYDRPTADLMAGLYKNHLVDKLKPAAALREAVLWLRKPAGAPDLPQDFEGAELGSRASDETTIIPSLHGRPFTNYDQRALARMPIIWASYTYHGV